MNAGGILGSMCFPSFPGFAGRLFATEDPEFSLALVQAYNDWHVEEWCGAYPARFIPMTLPVIWDPEACAKEIRRNAARGVHSLTFTENPAAMGYPSFHDRALEADVGGPGRHRHRAERAHRLLGPAGDHRAGCADGRDDHAAADEHRAGRGRPVVVQRRSRSTRTSRSPCPRVAPGGSRTSSIARIAPTRCTRRGPVRTSASRSPREVFRDHFLTCFISDPVGVELRDQIGIDNICWEADYPHSDSMWPERPRGTRRGAQEVQRARRRHQQDDLRERDALVPLGSVHATSRKSRPPSVRCARPPRATTCRSRP